MAMVRSEAKAGSGTISFRLTPFTDFFIARSFVPSEP